MLAGVGSMTRTQGQWRVSDSQEDLVPELGA